MQQRSAALWRSVITWAAAVAGSAAVLPYVEALNPGRLASAAGEAGLPVYALVAIILCQSAVLLALLTPAGYWLAGRVGLGAPLLDAALTRRGPPPGWRRSLLVALLTGVLCALAIAALDRTLFTAAAGLLAASGPGAIAPWKGLLASLFGGITEEVLMRLFALSLLAWILARLAGQGQSGLSPAIFWSANIATAVLFGLGHLPAIAELVELSSALVARSLLLNAIVALPAGWFFCRRGLESAMACHFAADIVLHVLLPLAGAAG